MTWNDETLMAYADGELDAATRASIEAAAARDAALAQRIEQHRALRARVAGTFAGILDQPVPARLVEGALVANAADAPHARPAAEVVPLPARETRAAKPRWGLREWGAMAASVALGAWIATRVLATPEFIGTSHGHLVARGELATALDTQLASNQPSDSPVSIGLSFASRDGTYCRSFTIRAAGTSGLACHADGEWRMAVTAEVRAGEGMRPAAAAPAAVLAAIDARIAGDALDAAGEKSARSRGWRGAPP